MQIKALKAVALFEILDHILIVGTGAECPQISSRFRSKSLVILALNG